MFAGVLRRIAVALKGQGIPYMVIGGQAVLVYGEPRLTKDIDITLGVGLEGLADIKRIGRKLGLKPLVKDIDTFVKETMVMPLSEAKSGIRIDFIFSFSPYERQAILRSKAVRFGRTAVQVAALEDVVIHKVVAGRPRDMEDVESILHKNPGYDARYIEKWLRELEASLDKNLRDLFRSIVNKVKSGY